MFMKAARRGCAALGWVACIAGAMTCHAIADDAEHVFQISIGDAVSDGVPGPGAGNLERSGSTDVYHFSIDRPALVYFDELGGPCSIVWQCAAPDASLLFSSNALCLTDPGSILLEQAGEYTITVTGNGGATGVYSFKLWEVPPPDEFVIALNQTVADGDPGLGAGNIEQPGSIDIYTLFIEAGTALYFDEQGGSCSIRWSCEAPDASVLFNNDAVCQGDPAQFTAPLTGEYVIRVHGNQGAIGAYSFKVWTVPPPDVFNITLDQTIAPDDPAPGAGHIEQPGSVDVYTLNVASSVRVYFDELSGSCNIRWTCEAPDGTLLFNNNAMCITDPGEFVLDQQGEYTITVEATQSAVGTYSLAVLTVETVEAFTIGLEQVVSDGVPGRGAGNIEEPGSVDQYTLSINGETLVFFDELAGSCSLHWRCAAPDGGVLFEDDTLCLNDAGLFLLDQAGDYIIQVRGQQGAIGTYSFTVWDVGEPDVFDINVGDTVSEGVPGPGAGFIEKPGRADEYRLTVAAGASACFQSVGGGCSFQWSAVDPLGVPVFEQTGWCDDDPGKFIFDQAGTYIITAHALQDTVGAYSFIVNPGRAADLSGECAVDVGDLLLLLAAWGDCPAERGDDCPGDLDGDGAVNVTDLLLMLADWG